MLLSFSVVFFLLFLFFLPASYLYGGLLPGPLDGVRPGLRGQAEPLGPVVAHAEQRPLHPRHLMGLDLVVRPQLLRGKPTGGLRTEERYAGGPASVGKRD